MRDFEIHMKNTLFHFLFHLALGGFPKKRKKETGDSFFFFIYSLSFFFQLRSEMVVQSLV